MPTLLGAHDPPSAPAVVGSVQLPVEARPDHDPDLCRHETEILPASETPAIGHDAIPATPVVEGTYEDVCVAVSRKKHVSRAVSASESGPL